MPFRLEPVIRSAPRCVLALARSCSGQSGHQEGCAKKVSVFYPDPGATGDQKVSRKAQQRVSGLHHGGEGMRFHLAAVTILEALGVARA